MAQEDLGVHINLTLLLPRDNSTLPLVRHLAKHSLWEIGVTRDCAADMELALTEACANVVEHACNDDEYEVEISLTDTMCEIRVVDRGSGFDFASLGRHDADTSSEGGRGIQLMRALVDNIRFQSMPEAGTVVHLVKQLDFEGDADRALVAPRVRSH